MKIEIELTEVEVKALSFVMSDPQEWTENAIRERARLAADEIITAETIRMINDPNVMEIPADKDTIILNYEG